MVVRKLHPLLPLLAVFGFASCSGGSGSDVGGISSCADAGAFCVTTCNLGCTSTGGCSISDIAQNQPLTFDFSQEVDPRSVNFATFSLKTARGLEPVGDFVVSGAKVTFVPEVRTVQGQTFYGFAANEEYLLSLTGGPTAPSAIVSTSGDRLAKSYNCTLRVTRGVVDLDQRAPDARVIVPTTLNNVPRDTNVVLEFSELIDGGPFFGTSGADAPVIYRIRRTVDIGSGPVCDPNSQETILGGSARLEYDTLRGVSILSYRPPSNLPAESCLEVEVTSRVRDLAGTRATAQVFRFVIVSGDVEQKVLTFDFANDLELDRERSGGDWTNGSATFARLGGDGRHGEFQLSDGARVTDTHYLWDTDSQVIPRKDDALMDTPEVTVTDGRFYFTKFHLPSSATLEFRGSNPAQIFVRGEFRLEGRIIGNATLVPGTHNGKNSTRVGSVITPGPGQQSLPAGPGGGSGGNGAWGSDGAGNPNSPTNASQYNSFDGYDGENLQVPAGHAYAGSVSGTGGRGAQLFPAHGNQTQLVLGALTIGGYAVEMAAGAGGGGYVEAGENGVATHAGSITGFGPPATPNTTPAHRGPPSPGGVQFPLLQFPGTFVSSNYFLVGGSGGGGGASQPTFALQSEPIKFRSGGAGAGGGGAIMLRVGADLEIVSTGRIEARGGSCDPAATTASQGQRGVPGPGGGGSGGTVLLQGARGTIQGGTIDVSGGTGALVRLIGFFVMDQNGGDGSPGFARLERAGTAPTVGEIGTTVPAAGPQNVGLLTETDTNAGFMSLWRGVGEVFAPIYERYEVDAEVDGVPVTYSDDPAVGLPAHAGVAPVNFYVQGVLADPLTGQPLPNERPRPWRRYVGGFGAPLGETGLNSDAPTGIRIACIIDRSLATNVVIRAIRIYYRS